MTREYEKRTEPVTFRTSERKAAWLNDVAKVRRIDRSLLCDEVMTDFLENQERVRTQAYRTPDREELETALEAASNALRGLIVAKSKLRKREKTA